MSAEVVRRLLQKKGMEVEHASNGKIAVELFSAAQPGHFDAVLMDIKMPIMGGLEAAKAIRASSSGDARSVPIIAITANAFEKDVEEARKAGMNEYLPKPLDQERLYCVLSQLLRGRV